MPHDDMRVRASRTANGSNTFCPVIGQIPPLARVDAITEPESQFACIEHTYKEETQNHYTDYCNTHILLSRVKCNKMMRTH